MPRLAVTTSPPSTAAARRYFILHMLSRVSRCRRRTSGRSCRVIARVYAYREKTTLEWIWSSGEIPFAEVVVAPPVDGDEASGRGISC